ncbi:MAG: DUF4388 domain-containing protein [Planctomycetota bacterium]
MTLKGKLENFGLGELLQTLALNRHTGTLVLERDDEHKKIYFSTGTITLLSTGQSVRIGDILRREGCVTEEQLQQASEDQVASGQLFGQILIDKGYVTLEDVQRALRKKVEEEIYDLFLWPDGAFEFLSDYCPAELMDPLQRFTQLKIDPSALIMEGLRQLDEFKRIREVLPDSRVLIQRVVDQPDGIEDFALELWEQVPSSSTVAEVLKKSPATRFHTMEFLFQCVQAGWIRTLDFHEHLAVARDERKIGNSPEAANLYQFLFETHSRARSDREFLKETGFFLADLNRRDAAIESLELAIEAYLRAGEHSVAWSVGLRLLELEVRNLDLLRSIWPHHAAGSPNSIAEVFDALAKALFEAKEHDELEVLLSEAEERFGKEASFWVLRGDNSRALGGVKIAAEQYERAVDYLREGRDDKEIIRLLRTIYDLDPDREDVAERLKQTLGRQELREATRRRRQLTAAGIGLAIVMIFAYGANYEVQARRLYDHARTLEIAYALDEQSLAQKKQETTADLLSYFEHHQKTAADRICSEYAELVDGYPWSSRADRGADALARLRSYEENLRAEALRHAKEKEEAERESRVAVQARYRELRDLEKVAIAERNAADLRSIRESLYQECRQLLEDDQILYPILIETKPSGADIAVGGKPVGKTPYLHEFAPGSTFDVAFSRIGCVPKSLEFTDDGRATLEVELERTAVEEIYFPPVTKEVINDGETFYASSHDGWLYATPNSKMVGHEARWRLRVGKAGHPSAALLPIGGDLLVASLAGTVQRVGLSGHPAWSASLDRPVRLAGIDTDSEAWVAVADDMGGLHLIEAETGRVRKSVELGFPVEALHVGTSIQVATRRKQRLTLTIPELEIVDTTDLSSFATGFTPDGGLLLRDNKT